MPITETTAGGVVEKLDDRARLIAQHDRIRAAIRTVIALARERFGESIDHELDRALTQLRAEWWSHDQSETQLLRTILSSSRRSADQIDRMIEDHQASHAEVWAELSRPARHVIARIEELCITLEAHMVGEERTYLSLHPPVLRVPRGTTPPRA